MAVAPAAGFTLKNALTMPNAVRAGAYTAGGAAGLGATLWAHDSLMGNDEAKAAEKATGKQNETGDELLAKFAPVAFVGAVALTMGAATRGGATLRETVRAMSPTTKLAVGTTGMFVGLANSTVVKSDGDDGLNHLAGLGMMAGVAAGTFAFARSPRVAEGLAQNSARFAGGAFATAATFQTGRWAMGELDAIKRSLAHKAPAK